MLVRIERNVLGPRVFIGRVRVHHWHSGLALIAWGLHRIWVDRQDWPWR